MMQFNPDIQRHSGCVVRDASFGVKGGKMFTKIVSICSTTHTNKALELELDLRSWE